MADPRTVLSCKVCLAAPGGPSGRQALRPGVFEAHAVGVPDTVMGQEAKLIVVPRPGEDVIDIREGGGNVQP